MESHELKTLSAHKQAVILKHRLENAVKAIKQDDIEFDEGELNWITKACLGVLEMGLSRAIHCVIEWRGSDKSP